MGHHDSQRSAQEGADQGDQDGLRLVDGGDSTRGRSETPQRRDLPPPRVHLERHRCIHEQGDHEADDEGEEAQRPLNLGHTAADETDRADGIDPREREPRNRRCIERGIRENRLHGSAMHEVHADEEVRPDVGPGVREQR